MKIGILSHPPLSNYGGILQAWALQTVLKQMGHKPELFIIKDAHRLPVTVRLLAYSKRFVLKYVLLRKNIRIFKERYYAEIFDPITEQHTREFSKNNINIRYIKSFSEIKEGEYDAFIVGSDQIWRPKYITFLGRRPIQNAFLEFAKNWSVKRIAYAPSFGSDEWELDARQTQECKLLAHKFDAISVRERGGVELCKKYLAVDAVHVLDPTLLISKESYCELFKSLNIPESSGRLLCYILDQTPDKQNLIELISKEKNLKPFITNSNFDVSQPPETQIQPPIEQWLRGFFDAEFVITDSFHACVFSIIFHKQFIVYGNIKRGMGRFQSLLSLFGLEDRLIYNSIQYENLPMIDYMRVDSIITGMKQKSMDFLINNLKF